MSDVEQKFYIYINFVFAPYSIFKCAHARVLTYNGYNSSSGTSVYAKKCRKPDRLRTSTVRKYYPFIKTSVSSK